MQNEKPSPAASSVVHDSATQLDHDHTGEGALPRVEGVEGIEGVNGEVTIFTDPDGTLAAVKFLGESACQLCKSQRVECYRTPDLRFRPHIWTSGGGALGSPNVLDLQKVHIRLRCENCIGSTAQPKCPLPGIGLFRIKERILQPPSAHEIDAATTAEATRYLDGGDHPYGTTVSRAGREIKATHKRRIGSLKDDSDGITEVDEGTEYIPSRSQAPDLSSSSPNPSSSQISDPKAYAVKRRKQERSEMPSASFTSSSVTPSIGGPESKLGEGKGDMDLINRLLNSQEETRKLIERQQRSIEVHQAREQVIWDAVTKGNL